MRIQYQSRYFLSTYCYVKHLCILLPLSFRKILKVLSLHSTDLEDKSQRDWTKLYKLPLLEGQDLKPGLLKS